MLTQEKIEEWLKEVEERPESAALILKFVTDRLRDLSNRNEQLLVDNIALQSGQRVEEYDKRIDHLEYQLELLKRQLGGADLSELETLGEEVPATINFLAYQANGRILRLEYPPDSLVHGNLASIQDELMVAGENSRLFVAPAQEELLLLFTSGRVSPLPVISIPNIEPGTNLTWKQAALPDEARAGEKLACLMPIAGLPLVDYFIQISRRGCVKKTMTSMAETILSNRFIGKGLIQKADQPFEIMLSRNGDRVALVTWEGHLVILDVESLSYTAEDRIRLEATDHVEAAFPVRAGDTILVVTRDGKVLQRDLDGIEPSKSPLSKGLALIPPSRLEKGTRLIGAGAVSRTDWVLALDDTGSLSLHTVSALFNAGTLRTEGGLLTITTFLNPGMGNA